MTDTAPTHPRLPNAVVHSSADVAAHVRIGGGIAHEAFLLAFNEDGVFIGPQACLTNDKQPRAINVDGSLKRADDWVVSPILVKYGASVGAAAVLLPGVTVGRFAMVGAGAVVTRNVPDYGLVLGNPARLVGYVCACGHRIALENGVGHCANCGSTIVLPHLERETI